MPTQPDDPSTPTESGASRGSLKIFLGFAAGVGKTYAMLDEATRRRSRGQDVVIGIVDTHGRTPTAELAAEFESLPPKAIEYRGTSAEELDTEAVVARKPYLALVDELEHSNAPGSPREKRWQDVEVLLDAGINVLSTLDVEHLESLNNHVADIIGTVIPNTVPDRILHKATEIEMIDIPVRALINRLERGEPKEPPVKCYEITKCSEKDRAECFVWKNFGERPDDLEDVKCWVLKGTYHEEGGQTQACRKCKYYLALNREVNVDADHSAELGLISCAGAVNSEKTGALEKVWDALKKHNKYKVILDLSRVTSVYSCGLSLLVKIHKETVAAGGMMVVVVGQGQAHQVLHSSKLTKIFHLAPDQAAARELFEAAVRKKEEDLHAAAEKSRRAAEEARKAAEAAAPVQPQKKFVRCWEYWKNQNPHNATTCDECSLKQNPNPQACWVIEGNVEGVTFHFVNEACVDCKYFEEYAKVAHA